MGLRPDMIKPYDKMKGSQCPECGQSILFKGRREWSLNEHELLWGCCNCEIEGSSIVPSNFVVYKERKNKNKKNNDKK